MTPLELVQFCGDLIERPDLTIDRVMVRESVRRAIYTVHGLDRFERDLTMIQAADYPAINLSASDSSVTITVPSRWKKLAACAVADANGEYLIEAHHFSRKEALRNSRDYFGLKMLNNYQMVGNDLTISWASRSGQAQLLIAYYANPTFEEFPADSGTWITDSWILQEFPFVVADEFIRAMNAATKDTEDFRLFSQQALEQKITLIGNYGTTSSDNDMRS